MNNDYGFASRVFCAAPSKGKPVNARNSGFVSAAVVFAALATGCSAASNGDAERGASEPYGQVSQTVTYSPQPVSNNTSKRVFMHVMPWFEAKATQHGYSRLNVFGQHWTMANCKAETNGLLNRVCADDSPLIGPYSSSDPYVVEYHLLLMKYSGVDGISIDWPGTTVLWDFPDNKFNSEAYIQRLNDFGLNFLIVQEDRNCQSGVDNGRYANVVDGARNDLNCLKAGGSCGNMYFGHPKYERLNGVPVLATFGPITLQSGAQWASAYAGAGLNEGSTYHIALWNENSELGTFNDGSFAWIWQDQNSFLWHQQNYLNNHPFGSIKMASVFPGYDPYYARGGWPTDGLSPSIAANGTSTASQLLDISLASNANYIQLNTWNDVGEDTEFEPTVGDGTRMLETLQQKLGVPYSKSQLDLIKRLFDERVKARKAGNTSRQNDLDQASAFLAALNVSAATSIVDGTAPPPQTQKPHGSGNAVPGTVQAENYDDGGEGLAFHDTSVPNEGGALRTAASESVDVETTSDTGGGYNVGWTNTGEWLEYTFTTSASARYDLKVRVASASTGGKISLALNEGPALGAVRDVPNTGGWQTYTDLTIATGQQIASGTQVLRVNVVAGGFNLNNISLSVSPVTPTCGNASCESGESCSTCPSDCGQCSSSQTPFGGSATALPGVLAMDRFDNGGEGVAYHDDALKNGAAIRSETMVDLENTNNTGVNVGWTAAGEWLEWTVNVTQAGSYNMNLQTAGNGGTFKFTVAGATTYDSGALSAAVTTGWQTYQTVTKSGFSLNAGTQVIRLEYLANVAFNLKNLEFVRATGTPALTKTLQNVANGQYAYREGSVVKYTANPAAFGSAAQWTIEDFSGFKRIRNVGNSCLVHIEHLLAYAECDTNTSDTWFSNRWTITLVGSNNVFSNAWKGTELNCFGNPPAGVQCTERGTSTDAQWVYTP